MQFKEGIGWKACYDETTGKYTAERGGSGYYHLYEITKDIFEYLKDGMSDRDTYKIIGEGRHLYMDVNDRCGPPYTVVFDDAYNELCPWADVVSSGKVCPDVLTDAAVELFESEANNREQRRKKREQRKNKEDMNMDQIGTWIFHSIAGMSDDMPGFLTADEYMTSPMPYIDESDAEAVADEQKERRQTVGTKVKICPDGNLYLLMPLPDGTSQEEIDKATAAGIITLMDGMMTSRSMAWEERDGELWYCSGIEGEICGEKTDGWVRAIDDDGLFCYATMRFQKI